MPLSGPLSIEQPLSMPPGEAHRGDLPGARAPMLPDVPTVLHSFFPDLTFDG